MSVVLINHPAQFRNGVRILMRTLRAKDGGKVTDPDRVADRVVSRNIEEYDDLLAQMLRRRTGRERIYSTADARDMHKAIRLFKERQLEADYYDVTSRDSFYADIHNRWISALVSPRCAVGTTFLVDVDDAQALTIAETEIASNGLEILHTYPTKNGKHIILRPFNPQLVSFEVKKNSMMLVAYESGIE